MVVIGRNDRSSSPECATYREIAAFVALNGEGGSAERGWRPSSVKEILEGTNTHGPMTLVAMLLEDVALTTTRPGSWEGSHMGYLLTAHGYRLP